MNGGGAVTRFSESAPRPPVFPGEENVHQGQVKMDPWAARFGASGSRRSGLSPSKGSSPILTPRRHGGQYHPDECDSSSRRYEAAEGSASTSPPLAETPPYLRWAENLHFLLADPDGVELFEKYLEQENCSHLLKFWFACEGLKRQWTENPDRAVQIIQVIHKKYIRPRRVNVSELTRREINDRVANKATLDANIFDGAQKEVEDLIRDSIYFNFLNSDVYLSYIQSMQNGLPDSPRSGGPSQAPAASAVVAPESGSKPPPPADALSISSVPDDRLPHPAGPLPTLHEDTELSYTPGEVAKPMPLTLKALMATKDDRMNAETRPVASPYSGRVMHPYHTSTFYAQFNPVSRQDSEISSDALTDDTRSLTDSSVRVMHPYHTSTFYAQFNPVSRQDSEISSDALTDDTRSLTDSSVDGSLLFFPTKPNRHQIRKAQKMIKRDCMQNRDPAATQPFIPRTHRPPPKEQMTPQQPHEFASLLIQKLEAVKRERESEEKLLRIVTERDSEASGLDESFGPSGGPRGNRPGSECSARVLAEALSKIAPSNEADTQSILDNHVQRIWSDQTPLRSPGAPSPRPWSPENRRRLPPNLANPGKVLTGPMMGSSAYPANYFQRSSAHHRRKEKDLESKGSVYSADSGTVPDMSDGRSHFTSKSQSIPDTRRVGLNPMAPGGATSSSAVGMGPGKKGSAEYDRVHDSGLCLHDSAASSSAAAQAGLMAPPAVPTKEKVLNWFTHNEKWQEGDRDPQQSSSSGKHRSRPQSSTSPVSSRRSRKQVYGTSRSESLERAAGMSAAEEEAARNRPPTKPKPSVPNVTTAKKPTGAASMGDGPTEYTVVTFTFGDEAVPYRSRIPGRTVTLKQFKETCLPKKGNYKYYFKTNCEEDVASAVNLEVIDDSELLPFWEDKVIGIVKLVD